MVSIKRWNEPEKFWELVEEWQALLKSLNYQNAFMSPCWLGLTFDYFVRDEELNLFEIRDTAGRLAGIIPLVARRGNGRITIEFPSGHGFGHYDFIIDQQHRREAITEALRLLRGTYVGEDVELDLGPIPSGSPNIWALENVMGDMGVDLEKVVVGEVQFFELPSSMDELILSLKSSDKRKFTKLVKRAHRLADMKVERVTSKAEVDDALDKLFFIGQLLGKEWDPGLEAFIRESARILSQRGNFEILYLTADSWPVAAAILMKFDGVVHILLEDVNPDAFKVEPGAVLFVHILESAISQGFQRLEILDEIEGLNLSSLKSLPLYRLKARMKANGQNQKDTALP